MQYDLEVFIFSSWPVFSSSLSEVYSAFQLFGVRTRPYEWGSLGMGAFSLTSTMTGREHFVTLVIYVTLSENGYIYSAPGCF